MSGRQPEAASDLAKLIPAAAVMWFAGASANFPCPCPYPLLGHPSINAAWHRLLRKMTFATEAVLTTLTRDGRVDRQMNRRSDAAAFDGMEESERKITWRKEMGREREGRKEGRASPLSPLCSQRILDQKVVHRSLVPSPFSPFPLYSSFPLPPLSLHSAPPPRFVFHSASPQHNERANDSAARSRIDRRRRRRCGAEKTT